DSTDSSITLRQPTVVKAVSRFCESSTTPPILQMAAALLEARGREGSGPFRCRISTVMGRERLACCKVELDRAVGMAGKGITATENGRLLPVLAHQLASARFFPNA